MRSTIYHAGRQCSEIDILDASPACPFCDFPGDRKPLLRIQTSPDVLLLSCPSCDAASASRMPKPETLSAYYRGYYHNSDRKFTFYNPERFADRIFRLVARPSKRQEFRILDFGGGDGTISVGVAKRLLRAGSPSVKIDLVDYQELPPPGPASDISIRHSRSLSEIQATPYDLVLASSIIEHLPSPRPDIERLFSALAPGGNLYARTPWMAPIFRIYERLGQPFDFTYPAHVHDLGRTFWENLPGRVLRDSSYRLRHSRPSPVESAFRQDPIRTLAAHVMKSSYRLFTGWRFVGGWEVLFERARA